MSVTFRHEAPTAAQYVELLADCSLGGRRPLQDAEQLVARANLHATAWEDGRLVGLARGWSDGAHATYLADLAVRDSHQRRGIGQGLIRLIRELEPRAMIVLIAAPQAHDYYGRIGFAQHRSCWILKPGMELA